MFWKSLNFGALRISNSLPFNAFFQSESSSINTIEDIIIKLHTNWDFFSFNTYKLVIHKSYLSCSLISFIVSNKEKSSVLNGSIKNQLLLLWKISLRASLFSGIFRLSFFVSWKNFSQNQGMPDFSKIFLNPSVNPSISRNTSK